MRQEAFAGLPGAETMRSADVPLIECGRVARRTLARTSDGIACAIFRRSCYLEYPGGRMICVGDRALGRGPLNAHVERFEPPHIGVALRLGAEGAAAWQPSAPRARPRRTALDALRAAARNRIPSQGLGGLVCGASGPLIEHARPGLAALEHWLCGGKLCGEVGSLLGLGPGLTPSGDDYLGGVLIALRLYGDPANADALWTWLGPRVPACTSLISAAHLAAAAEGEGHESLHACIDALAEETAMPWPERLERIGSVGHCSGWDGLAGVLAVADRVART